MIWGEDEGGVHLLLPTTERRKVGDDDFACVCLGVCLENIHLTNFDKPLKVITEYGYNQFTSDVKPKMDTTVN